MPETTTDGEPGPQLVARIVGARRDEILRAYRDRLHAIGGEPGRPVPDRVIEQAAEVLDDMASRAVDGAVDQPAVDAGDRSVPESLHASGVLFRIAVEAVVAQLPPHARDTDALTDMACVAHESIMHRFNSTAESYASYLLDRLHRSHVDERRRVARELHDIIAHSVAVVLQDLELFAVCRRQEPDRAETKLEAAMVNLRDTLDMIRAIAQDLRRSAADGGLVAALRSYLESAPFDQGTELEVVGDEERIPPGVRGELFLVLREALRNAHVHASAAVVRARIEIDADAVRAEITDDGRGFDPHAPSGRGAGTGLASMRERVALLGGVIEVDSVPGDGTSISVRVPLTRAWYDGKE